jgi:hypothetical protein
MNATEAAAIFPLPRGATFRPMLDPIADDLLADLRFLHHASEPDLLGREIWRKICLLP